MKASRNDVSDWLLEMRWI